MIHEERYIRGVSGGMFLSRYVQDAAAAGKKKFDEKRSGKSTAVEDFARHSVEADQDAAAAGKEEDKE